MRVNAIKRIIVTDSDRIVGVITQESLANVIRAYVLEKTFRPYRALNKRTFKTHYSKSSVRIAIAGIPMIVPAFIRPLSER